MKWNEETWYSRLGALIVFLLVMPTLTFYIGRQYERTVAVLDQLVELNTVTVSLIKDPSATVSTSTKATKTSTTTAEKKPPETEVVVPKDSGIQGTVMLGPTCPVMRIPPDPACADKSYATLVSVFKPTDMTYALALTKSDAEGKFSVALAPGTYVLGAGERMLPRCDHPEVTVTAHSFATTTITCDTGIR